MIDVYKELSAITEIETGMSFRRMTTLRIGGNVAYVAYPSSVEELDRLLRFVKENGIAYKMIGRGSDLLCSDDDYNGVVIRLDKHFNNVEFDHEVVTVEAGLSLIALSVMCMQEQLSGLEFASGIPGTVGGAIFMNAGAYKMAMIDVVSEVEVYRDGRVEWITKDECEFSYRTSIFQKHPDWIILGAKLKLTTKDSFAIQNLMDDRKRRRQASQPLDMPSCGSVFRNPAEMPAWQLIEGIGYRGKSKNDVLCSDKHCNFIVNKGNASASDYLEMVTEIQEKVKEKYGIELETEMEKFNWK